MRFPFVFNFTGLTVCILPSFPGTRQKGHLRIHPAQKNRRKIQINKMELVMIQQVISKKEFMAEVEKRA